MNTYSGRPLYDVIIVGGGPAGLNAALVLGRACKSVILFDDGQPRNRAAKSLYGFIGRDGSDPRQLAKDARFELTRYKVKLIDATVVEASCIPCDVCPFPTGFTVKDEKGNTFFGRKIIFATGVCDELPVIPGFTECYGGTAHHCPYCDGWEHRGKRMFSYGQDSKSAIGLALTLKGWSDHVMVLTDGKKIEWDDHLRLEANSLAAFDGRVNQLVHDDGKLKAVELTCGAVVQGEAFFFNTSQRPHSKLPKRFECLLDSVGRTETYERQNTSQPGVFVAGDADGDVQFIIVASAEGAIAALAVNRELQDEDRM